MNPQNKTPHIFLDCDGVLADFDTAALALFGEDSRQAEERLGKDAFWARVQAYPGGFYNQLAEMPDARELFEGVRHLHPTILTGAPEGDWAEPQKLAWAAEHFPGVPVIVCRASQKCLHLRPGDVLIDDYLKYRHLWLQAGGHFIHHRSAQASLAELRAYLAERASS